MVRVIGMAIHPAKLGIGLIGIVMTFLYGGLLDRVWLVRGGVGAEAIERFIETRDAGKPYEEPGGGLGISYVWREHSRRCVLGLLGSSLPGSSVAEGTPLGEFIDTHGRYAPLRNIRGLLDGVWWMLAKHTAFFVFYSVGFLLIWAWCGGAICRVAAVHFARDERLTIQQGLSQAKGRLTGGYLPAPCIPVALMLLIMAAMALGGLLLRIPLLGDVLGGVLFVFSIVGGFVIFLLLVGLLVGGSLFWPAVAVDGADAFDAFSRGLSYPLTRPIKAVWYLVVFVLLAALSWVFVNMATYTALDITRTSVAFGTAPFGAWQRELNGQPVSKLELLWPLGGPNELYRWPEWGQLGVFEFISAALIGLFVSVVIGLMWSYLASFYFSASTVAYILLRRDVDGTDVEDVLMEEEPESPGPSTASSASSTAGGASSAAPSSSSLSSTATSSAGSSGVPAPSTGAVRPNPLGAQPDNPAAGPPPSTQPPSRPSGPAWPGPSGQL